MRLLATGDFHIGAGAAYGPRPGDRLRDQEAVLEKIVALAREENVDAVLFAGDAFERRRPSPEEIHIWQEFIYEVDDWIVGGPISIDGNHDVIAADAICAPELASGGRHSRVPEIVTIKAGNTDPEKWVDVAILPWTPPARLVASQGGGDRDELNSQVADLLIETARGLREQIPEGRTSILLAHWSVSGASTPTGMDVGLLREPVLPSAELLALGFDYIVLGHIHETQVIGSNLAVMRSENGTEAIGTGPVAFYVGSPMILNFGEAQGHHGVMLLDTEARSLRHIEIPDRRFVTVDVDLTEALSEGGVDDEVVTGSALPREGDGSTWEPSPIPVRPSESAQDETDRIAAAIAEHFPLTDAVVRLRYRATAEQARRVDHAALRGLLADAGVSKLYSIAPEIVRSDRARVEGVDETMDAHEALIAWTQSQGIGGEVEERLEQLQNRYLEEVAL